MKSCYSLKKHQKLIFPILMQKIVKQLFSNAFLKTTSNDGSDFLLNIFTLTLHTGFCIGYRYRYIINFLDVKITSSCYVFSYRFALKREKIKYYSKLWSFCDCRLRNIGKVL